jgi:hypothetical protein
MMLDAADLDAAVVEGILDADTKAKLVAWAATRRPANSIATPRPRFDPTQALYYAGALIVMTAMGLFATAAFGALGGWALATIAVAYAAVFTWLGDYLWRKADTRIPGGLCVAISVSLTPLAIYGGAGALEIPISIHLVDRLRRDLVHVDGSGRADRASARARLERRLGNSRNGLQDIRGRVDPRRLGARSQIGRARRLRILAAFVRGYDALGRAH